MHAYTPATPSTLEVPKRNEFLHAHGGQGSAVTEALRESSTEDDDGELADVTFDKTARASFHLLDVVEEKFPHCRVITFADVEAEPQSDMGDVAAKVDGPISLADVTILHIDTEEAGSKIEAAIDAVDKADSSDEDAELTIGDALEVPLA